MTTTLDQDALMQAVALIENDPNFRVLRRFRPQSYYNYPTPGLERRHGMYLDFEATSTDPLTAEVIEVGAARFTFDSDGLIYSVGPMLNMFEQPSIPIPAEVVEITGITDEMVAGHRIDNDVFNNFTEGVDLVIAHNADYDRRLGERRLPILSKFPWACSQIQVDWKKRECVGAKLENVLAGACREFYDAHRAVDDALVGIRVLTSTKLLEDSVQTALAELLATTRTGVFRVYAHDSPFEKKDVLKARGYRWTGQKPWKRDMMTLAEATVECGWLTENRIAFRPDIVKISAKDRYSERAR